MKRVKVLIVLLILFLALVLKLHNYEKYPQRGASSDEYTYSFLGISLLTEHVPVSWSYFSPYKHKYDLTIDKLYFPIVYPYFDHPPLNGLLVGGWALLFGQDTFSEVRLQTIRIIPIILSMISSLLVFLIANRLFGYKTGIWALLIYTTTTLFVMNTRVVFAENLLTPLFLGGLYYYISKLQRIRVKESMVLGIFAGLSFLTKELGIAVFLSFILLFLSDKLKLKYITLFAGISILLFSSYFLYGIYFDKDVFFQILSVQSLRRLGPETLQFLMSTPIIVNKTYFDGWYFLGLISLFAAFHNPRTFKALLIPAGVYFFLLLFSLNKDEPNGWYTIPLYPFFAICTAALLIESIKRHTWFVFAMILFVGSHQISRVYEATFGLTATQFRIQLIILFVPLLLLLLFKRNTLFGFFAHIWFYIFVIGNILITYYYIHPA